MRYVALLRGINVGGASKISMTDLRGVFEDAGMTSVRTYINSGNVLFTSNAQVRLQLTRVLEDAIHKRCGVNTDVQLRNVDEMTGVVNAIPEHWVNDASMKCDVVFLQPEVDSPATLEGLQPRPGIEDAVYVPGAIIWRVDRENATRSRLTRMVGTPLYSRVTVRNCNTTRKLLELLQQ